MLNRSFSAVRSRAALTIFSKPHVARCILAGAIAPASLAWVHTSSAADVLLPPDYTLNSDTGAPVYNEGLIEGFVGRALDGERANDDETTPNPNNSSPELTIRMGQLNPGDPPDPDGFPDGWANSRTWIYTGQMRVTTNFLAFVMNNDDTDWLKINGVIVLDDNQWDNPVQALSGGAGNNLNTPSTGGDFNLVAGLGLTVGNWYDVEFRISDTGAGGAGPSGQGAGWNASYGVGMNTTGFMADGVTPLDVSVNGADYVKPAEPAGGGATLFRYFAGFGTDDNLRVQSTSTITVNGTNPAVSVSGVRFENGATPATLTINDGTGSHKTLTTLNGTTLATANNQAVTIAGTADFRPGVTSDGAFTGVTVTSVGPGALIFDAPTGNDLNGTTLRAGTGGRVFIQGTGGNNPLNSLATPLTISGDGGLFSIGAPTGAGQTYNNAVTATESGTLAHTGQGADTLGSATRGITVAAGKTLTVNNTGGNFTLAGPITGAGTIAKTGGSLVRATGNVNVATLTNAAGTTQLAGPNVTLANVSVTGGRLEITGQLTLTNSPTSTGGTLAILNPVTNNVPNPFVISGGTVEAVPTALTNLGANSVVNLTGGTLSISTLDFGLNGFFYNGDDAGANANFGTFSTYDTYFTGRGAPAVQALTSGGGTTELSFNPSGSDAPMYAQVTANQYNSINNIVSRMKGKIAITVAGNYTFGTTSDDGSMLFIDGQTVVSNNLYQGMTRRSGTVFLTAGTHDIDIGFYEGGGGNGLIVDWAGPGFAQRNLENRVLFPDLTPTTFDNVINVMENSGINVISSGALVPSLTVQPGKTLTTSGTQLTAPSITLNGAGTYTFNTQNTFLINSIAEGGAAINLVKSGVGVLVLDNTTAPQLQNAADTLRIDQGLVGVVLQTGGTRPTGNAAITMNGGGVLVSSKGGNQTFNIPYALTGDGAIIAGQTASGVAGPITVTVSSPLNLPAGRTFTVGSRDNYTLVIGGTTTGTGTLAVNGGVVIANDNSAENVNLLINPPSGSATLNITKNNVTLASLSSAGGGSANLSFGTGTGSGTFTLAGTANGRYVGAITATTGTTANLVKNGTAAQSLIGPTPFSGVTMNDGTLEVSPDSIGTGLINLAKGTLQFIQRGLRLAIYDSDPNATGAYGNLNTIGQVQSHYAALDLGPTPPVITNTANDGNTVINYVDPSAAGLNGAPFAIHGNGDADTIEALFTGKLFVSTPGDYRFSPRSDDGTTIFIDGGLVVYNNFPQGIGDGNQPGRDRTITLTAGYHDIAMTFNEGTGGAGMFVNVTPPGEAQRLLSNLELFTADVDYTNNVNLTGNATLDLRGGTVKLGGITQSNLATLTATAGTVAFTGTTSTGATLNYAGAGNIIPGTIANPTTAITINQAGPGNLLFNSTTPELTNASSVINVNGGSITSVGTSTVNPLGLARVNLNGGELRVSSTSGDLTLNNPVVVQQSSGIAAGNFGAGAVNGPITTTLPGLTVGGGQVVTLRSQNDYTLSFSGAVSGAGDIAVSGGTVAFRGATTPNRLTVNGGLASIVGSLAPTAGTTVNTGGTLGFNPGVGNTATYSGGPLSVNGGTVRAQSGITDLSAAPLTFTTRTSTVVPNALLGRFLGTGGEFVPSLFPGNTDAGIAAITRNPAVEAPLTAALSFGPQGAGDGPFSNFFGGVVTAQRFSAGFVGNFTAPATGAYQAQAGMVDDFGGFWIDLNQNGLFEQTGSAGSELISSQGCCGDGPTGTANLVAGQTYRVAIAVEDTGGGSSLAGRAALPGGGLTTINPGDAAQAGLWSYTTFAGGGNLVVDPEAQLRMSSVTGATDINLVGNNSILRLNSGAATTSTTEVLRATGAAGEISTVDLGANNTLNAALLNVGPNTTMVKTGPGTLASAAQVLSANSTLQIDGGVVALNGPDTASANTGSVVVNNTGVLRVGGAIGGNVAVAAGGTLEGNGRVGPVVAAGNVSPGTLAAPLATLTTRDLTLDAGRLTLDLQSTAAYDRVDVTGTVTLQNNPQLAGFIAAGGSIANGDLFFIVNNDGTDPVIGGFSGIGNGGQGSPGFVVLNNQPFFVSYFGDSTTNGFDVPGGNDIVLRAVPEPQTWATVMSGIGALVGLQRFRRRRK